MRAQLLTVILTAMLLSNTVHADDRIGPKGDRPPRKVIVGTSIYGPYGQYPGLEARLKVLSGIIDDMAAESAKRNVGRGLDLAILPEDAITSATQGQRALWISLVN